MNTYFQMATQAAVRKCQEKFGLPVTGCTDRTFWDLLCRRSGAPRSQQPPALQKKQGAISPPHEWTRRKARLRPVREREKAGEDAFLRRIEYLRRERVRQTHPFVPPSRVPHLIATAKRYLGVPYVYGGTTPKGFDCSGFVQYVFKENKLSLPRTADAQYLLGLKEPVSSLREGDLVFFATDGTGISHCGIYLGHGRFIHASSSHGIRIDELSNVYWRKYFVTGKHIVK